MCKLLLFPRELHAAAAAAKSLQSCLTLCNPIDGSPTTTNHLKEMSNMKEREYAQRVEELIPKEAELIEETKES